MGEQHWIKLTKCCRDKEEGKRRPAPHDLLADSGPQGRLGPLRRAGGHILPNLYLWPPEDMK